MWGVGRAFSSLPPAWRQPRKSCTRTLAFLLSPLVLASPRGRTCRWVSRVGSLPLAATQPSARPLQVEDPEALNLDGSRYGIAVCCASQPLFSVAARARPTVARLVRIPLRASFPRHPQCRPQARRIGHCEQGAVAAALPSLLPCPLPCLPTRLLLFAAVFEGPPTLARSALACSQCPAHHCGPAPPSSIVRLMAAAGVMM